MRNGLIILLALSIITIVCNYILIKHTDPIFNRIMTHYDSENRSIHENTSSSTFFNLKLANELLMIYEQQLARLAAAPFLPTYQNYRLKFKLNITSIATHLYGNFIGSNRHLQVVCFAKFPNTPTLHEALSFNLNFSVKTIDVKHVQLTLENSSIPTANKHIDIINIEVNQTFSIDIVFSFTYQWTDLKIVNSFDWPAWPLQKPCIDSIEYCIRQNDSKLDYPCLVTNTLTHLTSRQMFLAEQSGVIYWLDKQYAVAQLGHPLLSKAKTRRPSPMEFSMNSTICSPEFNKWISTYQQWHENITATISHLSMTFEQQRDRIVELNIRFMLYEAPGTGVADRIVHLMTTYLIAVLTKRLFLFDSKWSTFFDVMQSRLNYDQISVIPWFSHLHILNTNLSKNSSKYFTTRSHVTSLNNIEEHYDYDREFPERILIFQGHMGRIVQMMTSNASIYRTFLNDDLRMSPENMFGCLYHSLLIHRLAALVERTSGTINTLSHNKNLGHSSQQILRAILSPMFYPIGIQIRTQDHLTNDDMNNKSQGITSEQIWTILYQHFIYCARDLVFRNQEMLDRSGQLPIGFLLSNAVGIRQTFLKRWQLPSYCFHSFKKECYTRTHGLYLLANPDIIYHVSLTSQSALALQIAMFDIFIFSFCEIHIITSGSGFGRIAVFASLRGRNIYSLSRDETYLCRNDSYSISLIDSGYNWSGI